MAPAPRVLARTQAFVRERLAGDGTGHDWPHVDRVRRMALRIAGEEGGQLDRSVVELAALLHDVADWKFHGGDERAGPREAERWLRSLDVDAAIVIHVVEIVAGLSYKGAGVPTSMPTREGAIVQDADRLDALGAIGIARTFAYGGSRGRALHDPTIPPELHDHADRYKGSTAPTINHFYEKLLLLKDRMNTETGRRIADERHRFLEIFLERFLAEWDGVA